jgi:hypothetical protein
MNAFTLLTHLVALIALSLSTGTSNTPSRDLPGEVNGNVAIDPNGTPIQLAAVGDWHGDEVPATPLSGWLGLVDLGEGRWAWRQERLHTEREHDDVVDEEGPQVKTGRRVWVNGAEPLFLVRGLLLRTGVPVRFPSNSIQEPLPAIKTFHVNGQSYKLLYLNARSSKEEFNTPGPGSTLVLESGGVRQTLAHFNEQTSDGSITLYFAGDLDGDGKLDLYLDITGHYNVSNRTLFLSSRARSGELVRAVARMKTTGC